MHSIFNLVITFMLIPFSSYLVKLSNFIIKETDDEAEEIKRHAVPELDGILLKTPAVAVEACKGASIQMSELTRETILMGLDIIKNYNADIADTIIENEGIIDSFEDKLNSYLLKISKSSVTGNDSRSVSKMMHCVGNFERISDHAVNLVESAQEMHDKGISFSDECISEIQVITDAISENVNRAFDSYKDNDLSIAHKVEPLEEVVDNLSTELKNRHIRRLQNDECTVALGYIFQDILTNLERISDHCSNIAGCLIETDEKTNLHAYLHDIKENDENFREEYHTYADEYFSRLGVPKVNKA